jgi:transcriptional regulator with XRE-family HTH domain
MASTGNNIQSRREALGLTREQLAQRLVTAGLKQNVTRLYVWRVETGKQKIDADSLPFYATALETTAADLVPSRTPTDAGRAGR